MKSIMTIEEIKSTEMEALVFFDQLCKEHNWKYYLAYGTLIGAARHKGFIPWDDDIDVMMLRDDYEKLMSTRLSNDRYQLQTPYEGTVNHYYGSYSKLFDMNTLLIQDPDTEALPYHVYIDIFPIDYVPDNTIDRKNLLKKIYRYELWNTLLERSYYRAKGQLEMTKRIKWFILHMFSKLIPPKYFLKKSERMLKKSFKQTNTLMNVLCGDPYLDVCFSLSDLDIIELSFEGKQFYAPKGYDKILTQTYGKYKELPPIEKQVSHHNYIAYRIK